MAGIKCPQCGLFNTEGTQTCDCGYDFETRTAKGETAVVGSLSGGRVRLVDIEMPFSSMVVFTMKWALASIPAAILLWLIFIGLGLIVGYLGAPASAGLKNTLF